MGCAARAPRLTVTLLCSAIVEMSNGSLFCCREALDDEPATCDAAGTMLVLLLVPGLACNVMPAPAALVVLAATSPAVVSVAESMGEADEALTAAAGAAFGGALPPAMTVMAWVWRVEGDAPIEPIGGMSWKGAAEGADMGNEPAGQLHAQLQTAAAAAAVPFPPFPPLPATTVIALPGAETVVEAMRPSGVRAAELIDLAEVEDVGRPGAIAAAPAAVLLLATTVIALAPAAEPAAATGVELPPCPLPATTVMAPADVELVASPAAIEAPDPLPATTVIAPPAAAAAEVALDPPRPASTVMAPPTFDVVVAATRGSWVKPAVLIDLAADAVAFAEFNALLPVPPDAMTVIAAAADFSAAVVAFPAAGGSAAAAVVFAPPCWVEPNSERSSEGSAMIDYAYLV